MVVYDTGMQSTEISGTRPAPTGAATRLLWAVTFLQGLSTLAVEVIAIRLAVPVAGSSATLNGVMLGVVLMALCAGYWRGGTLSARWTAARMRTALARNLLLAALYYGLLSFPLEAALLEKALSLDLGLGLSIGITACALLFVPVYLASQTVPLLAELTNRSGKAGQASGNVLFCSTLGSVVGGIATPIWLFPSLGVTRTGYVICLLLAVAGILAVLERLGWLRAAAAIGIIVALVAATDIVRTAHQQGFVFDSAYQNFRIVYETHQDGMEQRILMMDGGRASGLYNATGETSFRYIRISEQAWRENRAPRVLVIGAAGFTFPRDIAREPEVERVDAVDLDPAVKPIAERQFLRERLPAKVRFVPQSGRYALHRMQREHQQYGYTLLDAYYGTDIPPELMTVEFFRDVRAVSDRVVLNAVLDPELKSALAHNLLATFREAFGAVWVRQAYQEKTDLINILVTNWPIQEGERWDGQGRIYHDDRETVDRDRVALLWETE